jgi:hypothetical protein
MYLYFWQLFVVLKFYIQQSLFGFELSIYQLPQHWTMRLWLQHCDGLVAAASGEASHGSYALMRPNAELFIIESFVFCAALHLLLLQQRHGRVDLLCSPFTHEEKYILLFCLIFNREIVDSRFYKRLCCCCCCWWWWWWWGFGLSSEQWKNRYFSNAEWHLGNADRIIAF